MAAMDVRHVCGVLCLPINSGKTRAQEEVLQLLRYGGLSPLFFLALNPLILKHLLFCPTAPALLLLPDSKALSRLAALKAQPFCLKFVT